MLNILIVDDTQEKIEAIREVLEGYVDNIYDVPICGCTRKALLKCTDTRFDLIILDLFIPQNEGEVQDPENAHTFLHLIKSDPELICPVFTVGISGKEVPDDYEYTFRAETFHILHYKPDDDSWKSQLKNRLEYLMRVKRNLGFTFGYDFDVAIINALQDPEHCWMKKTLSDNWSELNLPDDDTTTFYTTSLKSKDGKTVRVITCYAHQMACTASATLTSKVILRFHPRYLFMTGIAAGLKGNGIGFGDILVASEVWDGMSGKFKEKMDKRELIFEPDYRHLTLNPAVVNIITKLKSDQTLLDSIKDNFEGEKPRTSLKIHLGPMTSVPAVIASEQKIADLKKHARKIIGLEMESYGMFYAANNSHKLRPEYVISIKSASDKGDINKTDKYQSYASYTSAALAKHIIENKLDF